MFITKANKDKKMSKLSDIKQVTISKLHRLGSHGEQPLLFSLVHIQNKLSSAALPAPAPIPRTMSLVKDLHFPPFLVE
jgi:hypothetical protein